MSETLSAVTRPALRYHGGKWRLAPWIIRHLPPHRLYVEPFGGAMSVLLRKPRSYAEIYNDLDGEIVNLFRVLRDPAGSLRLRDLAALTPYSRAEFLGSYAPSEDPIEQARRTLVRSWMAHGSSGMRGHKTGFRIGSMREYTIASMDWAAWPSSMSALIERLQGVIIECRPALQLIEDHDAADTLFYLDPPYMFETRSQKRVKGELYHSYKHELTDSDHAALLRAVQRAEGHGDPLRLRHAALCRTVARMAARGSRRTRRSRRSPHRKPVDQPGRRSRVRVVRRSGVT